MSPAERARRLDELEEYTAPEHRQPQAPRGHLSAAELVAVIQAGLIGGLLVTLALNLAWLFGISGPPYEMYLGTWLVPRVGFGAWIAGFSFHMIISVVSAVLYIPVFRLVNRSGTLVGGTLGLVHWTIAGMILGVVSGTHAMIPTRLPPPGYFGIEMPGIFTWALPVLYVVFGRLVGKFQQPYQPYVSDETDLDTWLEGI